VARAMSPGKPMPGDEPPPERSARLFVGNVDFAVEEVELRDFFEAAGFKAPEVTVVKDRDTGQPRGFAFVEIVGAGQAARAVAELNGVEFAGRDLRLNLADSPRGRR